MSMNAARAPDSSDPTSAFWLEKLKDAHAELLASIDTLAELTTGPVPAREQLVSVRWNVSKASLARRLLWGRILAHLAGRVDEREEDELRQLQEADLQLFRGSTAHIATWTADRIIDDWPAYCEASRVMRGKMLEGMAMEKRLLYPMLEAFEARSW